MTVAELAECRREVLAWYDHVQGKKHALQLLTTVEEYRDALKEFVRLGEWACDCIEGTGGDADPMHSALHHARKLMEELPKGAVAMTVDNLLHRLWTKAVGTEGYDKAEWTRLSNALEALGLSPEPAPLASDTEIRAMVEWLAGDTLYLYTDDFRALRTQALDAAKAVRARSRSEIGSGKG
jgi:hypothetical protein